jgi:hypothetical protein
MQLTHLITICDCGDNRNHIQVYAGQEIDQDHHDYYTNPEVYE